MEHKLAYIEAKALCYRAKIDDPFQFYRNVDDTTKYVFDVSVWLTEYSATVGSTCVANT